VGPEGDRAPPPERDGRSKTVQPTRPRTHLLDLIPSEYVDPTVPNTLKGHRAGPEPYRPGVAISGRRGTEQGEL